MFKESKGKHPSQQYIVHNEIHADSRIAIMRKVGPDFGVTIQVVAKKGEEYVISRQDSISGLIIPCKNTVPSGKSYINIRHSERGHDLSNFWKKVLAKEEAEQLPKNPFKI